MKKIIAEIYSCNKLTYKLFYKDAVKRAYKDNGIDVLDSDILLRVIDLSEGDTKLIQQQRAASGEHCRVINVYEDEQLKFLIGVSNTNYDEDMRFERAKTGRKNTYGENNYHANTYMIQGINKIFSRYFDLKEQIQNLKLYFYLLDLDQSYPHNKFNLFSYRELSTLGFTILNINEVNFNEFREYGFKGKGNSNIAYSSFNKLMNDKLAISARNSGNIPAYLQCLEIENPDGTISTEKYIYRFKSLGAQTYDSGITMWTLETLAKRENKNLEFLLTLEHYGFRKSSDKIKITKDLTGPVKKLLERVGININYETDEEILQERNRRLSAFEKAKKSNDLRNQLLFRNNLRAKGMQMKCAVCGCDIENLLEAAHLWGVSQIKDESGNIINKVLRLDCMHDLIDPDFNYKDDMFYKRYVLVNSGDNGVWLCSNHHTMFDKNYYCFESKFGRILIRKEDYDAIIKQLGLESPNQRVLDDEILTSRTQVFLEKRIEEFVKTCQYV